MTFSLVALDPTGAIGMAAASSSPAVGARCIHLRARVGGVASQNITDPRFGDILLEALQAGAEPGAALRKLIAADKTLPYRQIAVVDNQGRTASYSGEHALGVHRVAEGNGAVAAGNLLANESVPDRMLEAYNNTGGELEGRLLAALAAGQAAGGEQDDIRSSALAVVRDVAWRVTDLRVDWHSRPLEALREALEIWLPQRDDYVTRALYPDKAPSYGVAGDE
ncbi:MAG: DUF1028 domain-containing protein [Acetobacteraceae bacterium]